MPMLKAGDAVRVEFAGLVQSVDYAGRATIISTETGKAHVIAAFSGVDSADASVSASAPKYWPPETGDVWGAQNKTVFYHVIKDGVFHRRSGATGYMVVSFFDATVANPDLELVFRIGGLKTGE